MNYKHKTRKTIGVEGHTHMTYASSILTVTLTVTITITVLVKVTLALNVIEIYYVHIQIKKNDMYCMAYNHK